MKLKLKNNQTNISSENLLTVIPYKNSKLLSKYIIFLQPKKEKKRNL